MKRIAPAALALAVAALSCACSPIRSNHGYILERGQTQVAPEPMVDTQVSVLAEYGEPSLLGTFDQNVWYYVSSREQVRAFMAPQTQARNVVAVHFSPDGVVQSVDLFTLEHGAEIALVSRETPTRGKTLTFLEQLLGNVGRLPTDPGQQGPGAPPGAGR